jgi:hypothetical protein
LSVLYDFVFLSYVLIKIKRCILEVN